MLLPGVIKVILRNFTKNLTSSWIKILGLAISISAAILIWSYIINENKFDKGISTRDRIYRLETNWASMPPHLGHAINQSFAGEIYSTRLNFWQDVGIQVDNTPYNLRDLTFADSTFFKIFPLEFIAGDTEKPLSNPFSLVLTESQAKKLFKSTDAVGKIVKFENQYDFTVTAIIKDQPYLHFTVTALASISSLEIIRYKGVLKEYDGWSYPTYFLFPENIRAEITSKKITDFLKKIGYNDQFLLRPFTDIYYLPEVENESNTRHGNLLYNRILISVSVFILLLAAINFINLTIANAVSRSKEVRMKKLQGASRLQLVSQFLFETVLFILFSVVIAFLLLWFLYPVLYSLTGFSVNSSDLLSPENLMIMGLGLISFILISGIYPSLYISSCNINSYKLGPGVYSSHIGIRNGLIVFQNLVSITLICCTLIANQQFRYMNREDLGFDKSGIINLKLNSQLIVQKDLFRQKLLGFPEITSLSFSSRLPGNYWGSWCCVNIEGSVNKYFNNYIDPDYIGTMNIKIIEGRNFSSNNKSDLNATYLINETGIKKYRLRNPIGQVITPGNGIKGEIIGIIRDFHYRGLKYEQTPLIMFYNTEQTNYVNIRINKNNIPGALEKIKLTWDEMCPAFAFEYTFLDETYDLQYKSDRRFENLLFAFAILAVIIASIGLFGLSMDSIERRTKEIGIRKVNGATVNEVIALLNIDFIKWVAIAFVLACPLAWFAMNKWLQNFAYRTGLSWVIFVLAGILAFTIAILTISWQSWRAATRNPVEALRYE